MNKSPLLVDSHCHLPMIKLDGHGGTLDEVVAEAGRQGVGHMLCVSVDLESFPAVRETAHRYPNVFASVGVHPDTAPGNDPDVAQLLELAADPRIVAIGETGLDYYRSEGVPPWQHARFRTHIKASKECGKPLIIHTRSAREDTIRLMREEGADGVGGVMHCFTETWEMACQAMELGFYISFSGIVTFKNAEALRDVARRVPAERLLIETDSPFLAPVPRRGKQNQPAYVSHVAAFLAELRSVPVEALIEQTSSNFFNLFRAARPVH